MKPPFTYYGGKLSIADQIVACLPEHMHYVEPFAGSLAVLLAKPTSHMETVNDLDGQLMTFWRVLRDRPDELARAAALTPHSRAEQLAAYQPAEDELEAARRVWVRLTQARTGTLRKTGWRYYVNPRGSGSSMPEYLEAYIDRLAPAAERIKAVSLECLPASDIIAKYGAFEDALLYCDPPYLATTRNQFTNYRTEMAGDAEHRELAEALHAARAAVVLSGYHSPLYDQLYDGWYRHEIATSTTQGGKWAERTEVLWSNRPLPVQMSLFATVSSSTHAPLPVSPSIPKDHQE